MSVGLVVRRGQRTWQLERRLADDTLVFSDQLDGRPMTLSISELWKELQEKRLTIVRGDAPSNADTAANGLIAEWSSLPHKLKDEGERKLEYVRGVQRAGLSRGMRRRMAIEIEKIGRRLNDPSPPSTSTVMRDWREIDEANGAPIAVVAKRLNRKKRTSTKTPAVLNLARRALRDFYCTRKRPSLALTKVYLDRQLKAKILQGELSKEEATVSISTLQRLKDEIDPYALSLARYGAHFARNEWRYALKGNTTVRAMQRYEIDHTLVDLVVICDRTGLPLGRPTITVVVDAFSGYVTGFFVSFWGTGLATTLAALKVALSPKAIYTDGLGLTHIWLGVGLPELVVVDNGLEFHSPQFRAAALSLAMDLTYCAVRQPWLKPVVERTLGTYLNYLPKEGLVRKSLTNEVPISPDKTSAITFSDLCRGLLKAFVEVHPFEVNDRKLARPFDLFHDSLEELPPPNLPTSLDELDIVAAVSRPMTVGHEGVVPFSLRYNSRELQDLRRSIGTRFKTVTKFNPENLEYVYVQDPRHHKWLMVPSCQPEYTNGLSLIQHKAIRSHAREHLKQVGADEALSRSKMELIEIWHGAASRGKRLKSNHVKALAGLTSSQAILGQQSAPALLRPEQIITMTDLVVEAKQIPTFEAFEL